MALWTLVALAPVVFAFDVVQKYPSNGTVQSLILAVSGALASLIAVCGAQTERMLSRKSLLRRSEGECELLSDARWQFEECAARYGDLLNAQGDVIALRQINGEMAFANAAYRNLFGLSQAELEFTRFKPVVIKSEVERSGHAPGGAPRRSVEFVVTIKGKRWISWDEYRVADGDGGYSILQIGRDITETRRNEAEVREARDQALSANRAKSRFLASMSHEIRTPMNGILGMSSLLRDTELTIDQQTYVRAIDQSARALLALIDEILDFSKIEAGKLQLCETPFSPAACVQGALELLIPRAAAKGLALGFGVASDVPAVAVGDEIRVRQIVLNLVSNAVKFTDKGRVDVTVYPLRNKTGDGQTLQLAISVRDTGVGLTAEEMRRIFLEFEQAGAHSDHRGGTGLGLAISKRLARAMGGDIAVDGAPGKGSTFTAVIRVGKFLGESRALPQTTRSVSPPPQIAVPDEPAATTAQRTTQPRLRVLIAEDNEVNALLACRVIEKSGGTANVVTDGKAAIAAATAALDAGGTPFDLVLMDIFMPGVDGLNATRAIKRAYSEASNGSLKAPPIIALTANAFAEDRVQCLEAGMDDYLAKPFDVRDLTVLLARWVPGKTQNGFSVAKPAA